MTTEMKHMPYAENVTFCDGIATRQSGEHFACTIEQAKAAPDLLAFARRVMADHRAQLPSEARDLYGGGCGCPQCEQARAAIAKAKGETE